LGNWVVGWKWVYQILKNWVLILTHFPINLGVWQMFTEMTLKCHADSRAYLMNKERVYQDV